MRFVIEEGQGTIEYDTKVGKSIAHVGIEEFNSLGLPFVILRRTNLSLNISTSQSIVASPKRHYQRRKGGLNLEDDYTLLNESEGIYKDTRNPVIYKTYEHVRDHSFIAFRIEKASGKILSKISFRPIELPDSKLAALRACINRYGEDYKFTRKEVTDNLHDASWSVAKMKIAFGILIAKGAISMESEETAKPVYYKKITNSPFWRHQSQLTKYAEAPKPTNVFVER